MSQINHMSALKPDPSKIIIQKNQNQTPHPLSLIHI